MAYLIIAILCGVIGFFIGKYNSIDVEGLEEATAGLEGFSQEIETFSSDNERHLMEKYELCIPLLDALDENNNEAAKSDLIDEFGRFYHAYTYEDERGMNTATVENYLKKFEDKAKRSESYQLIISYQPED